LEKGINVSNILSNYYKDKNIIIVGPAPTLLNKNKGEYIDSFDCVIRLNNSIFSLDDFEKDYGTRTDVVYSNSYFWKHNKEKLKKKLNDNKINIIRSKKLIISKENINNNFIENAGFNAGVRCILDILKYDFKSLTISGFTFYNKKTQTYFNEKYKLIKLYFNRHKDLNYQKKYLLEKIKNKKNIIINDDCKEYFKL
jgi:hypothetical protein